jgi:hypothetical protein
VALDGPSAQLRFLRRRGLSSWGIEDFESCELPGGEVDMMLWSVLAGIAGFFAFVVAELWIGALLYPTMRSETALPFTLGFGVLGAVAGYFLLAYFRKRSRKNAP